MGLTMACIYLSIWNQLGRISLNHWLFFIYTLSIIFIAAAGNILNDIEDVDVDLINRKGTNQVGISFTRSWGMNWYFILTLTGLLMGLIVAMAMCNYYLFVAGLFIAMSLWFYSRWMQRQLLIGNLVIAILCALLPLLSMLFLIDDMRGHLSPIEESNSTTNYLAFIASTAIVTFYGFYAFSLTLTREIVKDIEDSVGDQSQGYTTLATQISNLWQRRLIAILILVSAVIGYGLWSEIPIYRRPDKSMNRLILLFIMCLPLLVSLYKSIKMTSPTNAHSVSIWLKIAMAIGILTSTYFIFI